MTAIKLALLVLPILVITHATSRYRYNNRAFRIHQSEKLKLKQDCEFNICENDSGYPETEVKNIVDKHRMFHSFLKGKVIEPSEFGVFQRSGGGELGTFCKTVDVVAAPKLMMDIDNIRRHIVNLKNYSQVLEYQTCDLQDGEECFKETILDVKTKCTQKFNNIKLVTVDVNDGVLEYRTFRIPTTCICTYSRDFK